MSIAATNCPDDRIVLARRGAIDPGEWDDLMAHVRVCDDCSAAWMVARSFERVGGAQPADEHLVRRAVQAALDGQSRQWRFTRHPMLLVAASVLLAAAAASAGVLAYRELKQTRSAPAPTAQRPAQPTRDGRSRHHPRQDQPVGESPLEQPPADESPAVMDAVRPARSSERSPTTGTASAAVRRGELFARATAARGAGRSAEAAALFQRLQREFPGTPEATVSLVSLGELVIASSPQAALASFDAYLRQAPSGPLVPEALAAKARVLDQLGRPADAEAARRELRRRIPEWPSIASPRIGQKAGPVP